MNTTTDRLLSHLWPTAIHREFAAKLIAMGSQVLPDGIESAIFTIHTDNVTLGEVCRAMGRSASPPEVWQPRYSAYLQFDRINIYVCGPVQVQSVKWEEA